MCRSGGSGGGDDFGLNRHNTNDNAIAGEHLLTIYVHRWRNVFAKYFGNELSWDLA